jgi:broad specificity phosphatase PhoE
MSPDSMQVDLVSTKFLKEKLLTYRTGVRDSVLTNHGVDQANRLGVHLAKTTLVITHIFASPLTRTSKTAEAIQKAQAATYSDNASSAPKIVKVPALIERVRCAGVHRVDDTD